MSVTDRCLTINGQTMNYHTGIQWKSNVSESVPFSNLQIGLFEDHPSYEFLVKNEGSSRKRVTFAHRQRDVIFFELLSSDLMIASLKD